MGKDAIGSFLNTESNLWFCLGKSLKIGEKWIKEMSQFGTSAPF